MDRISMLIFLSFLCVSCYSKSACEETNNWFLIDHSFAVNQIDRWNIQQFIFNIIKSGSNEHSRFGITLYGSNIGDEAIIMDLSETDGITNRDQKIDIVRSKLDALFNSIDNNNYDNNVHHLNLKQAFDLIGNNNNYQYFIFDSTHHVIVNDENVWNFNDLFGDSSALLMERVFDITCSTKQIDDKNGNFVKLNNHIQWIDINTIKTCDFESDPNDINIIVYDYLNDDNTFQKNDYLLISGDDIDIFPKSCTKQNQLVYKILEIELIKEEKEMNILKLSIYFAKSSMEYTNAMDSNNKNIPISFNGFKQIPNRRNLKKEDDECPLIPDFAMGIDLKAEGLCPMSLSADMTFTYSATATFNPESTPFPVVFECAAEITLNVGATLEFCMNLDIDFRWDVVYGELYFKHKLHGYMAYGLSLSLLSEAKCTVKMTPLEHEQQIKQMIGPVPIILTPWIKFEVFIESPILSAEAGINCKYKENYAVGYVYKHQLSGMESAASNFVPYYHRIRKNKQFKWNQKKKWTKIKSIDDCAKRNYLMNWPELFCMFFSYDSDNRECKCFGNENVNLDSKIKNDNTNIYILNYKCPTPERPMCNIDILGDIVTNPCGTFTGANAYLELEKGDKCSVDDIKRRRLGLLGKAKKAGKKAGKKAANKGKKAANKGKKASKKVSKKAEKTTKKVAKETKNVAKTVIKEVSNQLKGTLYQCLDCVYAPGGSTSLDLSFEIVKNEPISESKVVKNSCSPYFSFGDECEINPELIITLDMQIGIILYEVISTSLQSQLVFTFGFTLPQINEPKVCGKKNNFDMCSLHPLKASYEISGDISTYLYVQHPLDRILDVISDVMDVAKYVEKCFGLALPDYIHDANDVIQAIAGMGPNQQLSGPDNILLIDGCFDLDKETDAHFRSECCTSSAQIDIDNVYDYQRYKQNGSLATMFIVIVGILSLVLSVLNCMWCYTNINKVQYSQECQVFDSDASDQ